jgi:5-formyltetrahydrofolate cyclo-ligase
LSSDLSARRELRRRFRRERRALSRSTQIEHARAVTRLVVASGLLLRTTRVAAYIASDGELDPAPLLHALQRARKTVLLPAMGKAKPLEWRRYRAGDALMTNRFGIAEPPRSAGTVRAAALELVFVPLVAFDDTGHRLGRGGGHYDATFAPLARRPLLVGLAHELQHTTALPRERWDAPLDAVVTERQIYWFSARTPDFSTKPLSHALHGDT